MTDGTRPDDFIVAVSGAYTFAFRTYAEGTGEDSLYWEVDGTGAENLGLTSSGTCQWTVAESRSLDPGVHTLTIHMREAECRVGQLFISGTGASPP